MAVDDDALECARIAANNLGATIWNFPLKAVAAWREENERVGNVWDAKTRLKRKKPPLQKVVVDLCPLFDDLRARQTEWDRAFWQNAELVRMTERANADRGHIRLFGFEAATAHQGVGECGAKLLKARDLFRDDWDALLSFLTDLPTGDALYKLPALLTEEVNRTINLIASIKWSIPRSPSDWLKVFEKLNIKCRSIDAFADQRKLGTFRQHPKSTTKLVILALDCLPETYSDQIVV